MNADSTSAVPADLWTVFEGLSYLPMLLIRGALSDILSARKAQEMAGRHGHLEYVEVADRGHAPLLDEPEAVAAIEGFLERL